MKPKMIDIHSHIIPYTDDGAETWEDSLFMIQNADAEGIRTIVATPHILSEHHFKEEEEIIKKFQQLKENIKAAGLKIEMTLGCEIYAQPDTTLNHKIATLNSNGTYFLIEFPMNSIPKFAPEKLFDFAMEDKVPIIAHPERNVGFQTRPDFIYEYVLRGSLMQINQGSLLGRFGERAKTLSFKMIENNLAHFIASDGHKKDTRTVTLTECYNLISDKYGNDIANRLFYENPLKAINGEKINTGEPLPIERELKESFWQKLKNIRGKR
jgi:protein-tyrosine phosphatase